MAVLWEGTGEYEGWKVVTDYPGSNGMPTLVYTQGIPAPSLVGHKEVADIMGWSRSRLTTERSRGRFPEPLVVLASGPIWVKAVIEDFKKLKEDDAK